MRKLHLAAACAAALVAAAPAAAGIDSGGVVGDAGAPVVVAAAQPLRFIWPANGEVTRGFGYDSTMGEHHAGVDIGSLRSLDVHAAAPGTVEKVGYAPGFDGYGNIVLVDVGDGYETLYAHLSKVEAQPGELVSTGDLIGEAGSTGLSTGVHLHFELREDGTAVDPAKLLPGGTPTVPAEFEPTAG